MNRLKHQFELLIGLALLGIVPALCFYLFQEREVLLGLSWNIFLGLLPFYFAVKANSSASKGVRYFSIFLWLIFLPNAPYLITDLIHVPENKGLHGFVFYLVALLSFTGLLSWIFSVRLMLARLPGALRRWKAVRQYGYLSLCILSGIGVAMGRFARLNSWEIFYKPWRVVSSTLDMYTELLPWLVTICIALILYSFKDFRLQKFNMNFLKS
jgi:uncharacterized membrane protein